MAAITAARQGATVTIFETHERIGRKLLATGNGCCNLTNTNAGALHYHGDSPEFVNFAFSQLSTTGTIAFFHDLGLCTIVEDSGKVYPRTAQGSNVLDLLRIELMRLQVTIKTETRISSIIRDGDLWGLKTDKGGKSSSESFDKVIVACGGKSASNLGGTDSGLNLLTALGHSVVPAYPVLVPLKTVNQFNKQLKGVKVQAALSLIVDGKQVGSESGELLFMEYGISGMPTIRISNLAGKALNKSQSVEISIDIMPDFSDEQLNIELNCRITKRPNVTIENQLLGLIHKRLIVPVIQSACLDKNSHLDKNEVPVLIKYLKSWRMPVSGWLSWIDAQAMAGGISTAEINGQTMESLIAPGIYICGELIDITGDCGGYNLQWAWSSGYVAGFSASSISSIC